MDSHPHGYILRTFPLTVPIFHQGSAAVHFGQKIKNRLARRPAARGPAARGAARRRLADWHCLVARAVEREAAA
jgi:hypothetical protein